MEKPSSIKPDATIQAPKFGPGASKVFTTDARFIIAMGGQRGGKTTVGAYWDISQALQMREEMTPKGMKVTPPTGIICAPTYDQLNQATLYRFFEEFPSIRRYYQQYKKEINIPIAKDSDGKQMNSRILTRSLEDYDKLRGIKCWWIHMDEGDGASEAAWDVLEGRVADTRGKILVTSTIYRNSWINRKIYQPLRAGRRTETEIVTWPSIDNPAFPVEEWERLKKELDPIVFAREYESKFVFESGLVYGDILKYGVIDEVPEGVEMLATFYGLDYGLNDPTVILFMGYGSDGCWYVLQEYGQEMMSVDAINDVLKANLQMYSSQYGAPWATYYDPAGGIAALSIAPDVFPIAAVKDIPNRITLVRNFIYQQRVFILSHNIKTIKEMSLYAFDATRNLPIDRNNHFSDALGYVIHNAWGSVDGLQKKEPEKPKSRIMEYEERRGLLKDGVFQSMLERNEFLM